jgi:hypothetical protein
MKLIDEKLVMNDGTAYGANCGIIGLNTYDNCIYEGFDGILNKFDEYGDIIELPREHRMEIAEYMITAWTEYKDSL